MASDLSSYVGTYRDSMRVFRMATTDTMWFFVGPEEGYIQDGKFWGSFSGYATLRYESRDDFVNGWFWSYHLDDILNRSTYSGGQLLQPNSSEWETWNNNPNLFRYQFRVGVE